MFSPLAELTKNFIPSTDHSSSLTSSTSFSSASSSSSLTTVLITDDVHCDADFLVNHFLHSFVKSDSPAILVHSAQTFAHYQLVASKCGVNFQSAIDKKAAIAVDGMKLLADALAPSADDNDIADERVLTRLLFDAIVEAVDTLSQDLSSSSSSASSHPIPPAAPPPPPRRLLLLIDDLSLLSSLGVSSRHVAAFIYTLRRRLASLPVTFVFRLRDDVEEEIDDEDEVHLVKLFAHQSDAHFRVRGLSTGYCKEVHGAVDLFERIAVGDGGHDGKGDVSGAQTSPMTYIKRKERQFKIGEKSVSIFAPGLSAAVL